MFEFCALSCRFRADGFAAMAASVHVVAGCSVNLRRLADHVAETQGMDSEALLTTLYLAHSDYNLHIGSTMEVYYCRGSILIFVFTGSHLNPMLLRSSFLWRELQTQLSCLVRV